MTITDVKEAPQVHLRNLAVLGYAQGFTQWAYVYPHMEDIQDIYLRGYFNEAGDMLATGDVITVSTHKAVHIVAAIVTLPPDLAHQIGWKEKGKVQVRTLSKVSLEGKAAA
jgi:hypothetical protein